MGMDHELYRFRAIIGHQGPLLRLEMESMLGYKVFKK